MPFTPLPNDLIDRIMPTLKDTEWRLLCVIARQTLGWRGENGGRKKRDWLTQKQLKERTGRDSAALSQAVESLIARQLIMVSDTTGKSMSTVKARRSTRSRVYYGLHPDLLSAIVPKSELVESQQRENILDFVKNKRDFPSREAGKANGTKENETKETLTKEVVTDVFFENKSAQMPQTQLDLDTENEEPSDPQLMKFIEYYQRRFREQIRGIPPPFSQGDRQKLQTLLAAHSFEVLVESLEIFFTINFSYIRRQRYSLSVFVHSFNLLRAAKPRISSGSSKEVGIWQQAGSILLEHEQKGLFE